MARWFALTLWTYLAVAAGEAPTLTQGDTDSPGTGSALGSTKPKESGKNSLPDKTEPNRPDGNRPQTPPPDPTESGQLWGFWSGDSFFYPGRIERSERGRMLFRFNDGDSAWLSAVEIADVPLTVGMPVHGNWQRRGAYYQGEILAIDGRRVRVRYNDGAVEDTDRGYLRLAFHPWGLFTPGRRVLARWQGDEYWYPGTVEKAEENRCLVRFDDQRTAWLGKDGVALIQIYRGLRIEADYQRRGRYYAVTVQRVDGDRLRVLYDDGVEEETTVSAIRRTMKLRAD